MKKNKFVIALSLIIAIFQIFLIISVYAFVIYRGPQLLLLAYYEVGSVRFYLQEGIRTNEVSEIASEIYDKNWIIGKTYAEIEERYGGCNSTYKDVHPAWALNIPFEDNSYPPRLANWAYVIYFEDGIAVKTEVRPDAIRMGG